MTPIRIRFTNDDTLPKPFCTSGSTSKSRKIDGATLEYRSDGNGEKGHLNVSCHPIDLEMRYSSLLSELEKYKGRMECIDCFEVAVASIELPLGRWSKGDDALNIYSEVPGVYKVSLRTRGPDCIERFSHLWKSIVRGDVTVEFGEILDLDRGPLPLNK